MTDKSSERRLAENEVIFRERNERLQKDIDQLNAMAEEAGQSDFAYKNDMDTPLYFYCECSDENCTQRIPVKQDDYNEIHKNRKRFVVVNGHQVVAIESIIKETADYVIVEKDIRVPTQTDGVLNSTDLDNSKK